MPEYIPTSVAYLSTESIYTVPPSDLNEKYVPLWWVYQEIAQSPTLAEFTTEKETFFASLNLATLFNEAGLSEADLTYEHYKSDVLLVDFAEQLTNQTVTSGDMEAIRGLMFKTGTLESQLKYGLIIDANTTYTREVTLQNDAVTKINTSLNSLNRMLDLYTKQGTPYIVEQEVVVDDTTITEFSDRTISTLTLNDYRELNTIYEDLLTAYAILLDPVDADLDDPDTPNLQDFSDVATEIDNVIKGYESFYEDDSEVRLEVNNANLQKLKDYWQHDKNYEGVATAISLGMRNAVTALETQGEIARDGLRQTMFLFEEFYKTAGSILTKIATTLSKISANIAK